MIVSAPEKALASMMAARSVQLPVPSSQTPSPGFASVASTGDVTVMLRAFEGPVGMTRVAV